MKLAREKGDTVGSLGDVGLGLGSGEQTPAVCEEWGWVQRWELVKEAWEPARGRGQGASGSH